MFGRILPTIKYLMEVEVHVYAFSIAANVLLSFFPFLVVMSSICRALNWQAAVKAVFFTIQDYFPADIANIILYTPRSGLQHRQHKFELISVALLLFTANGIFEPLEVALNRIWGVKKNRSFLKNQLVSMGLIFTCGTLAFVNVMLTAVNTEFLSNQQGVLSTVLASATAIVCKMAAIPISITMFFLIYWILPNCKVSAVRVLPVSIVVGLTLELMKYMLHQVYVWAPFRAKMYNEYGPFLDSASIVFLSFLAAMVILAGAEWSARPVIDEPEDIMVDSMPALPSGKD